MRSSNKKLEKLFYASFLSVVILLTTCRIDDYTSPKYDKKVEAAKEWFEKNSSHLSVKRSDGSAIGDLTPDWEQARKKSNHWEETVEVELKTDYGVRFNFPENVEKYEETGDDRYLQSTTRLIIRTQKRTKTTDGFLMTVISAPDYMERTGFEPPKDVAYIGRDSRFSGHIIYHSLDGMFTNGWVYRNGEITNRIGDRGNSGSSIKRQAQQCVWITVCVSKRSCWQSGPYVNCSDWEVDYCEDVQVCVEVGGGSSNPENGNLENGGSIPGGGGGGYIPPVYDCHGVPNGSAYMDACGDCVGGITGNQPCDPNTPCNKLRLKDAAFKSKVDSLKTKSTSMNRETAYLRSANGYTTFEGTEYGEVKWTSDSPLTEFLHNHNTGLSPIYTIDDLESLFTLGKNSGITNIADFNFILVTPDAKYDLKITNVSEFAAFGTQYLSSEKGKQKARDKMKIREGMSPATAEKRFLEFISGKGLSLYKAQSYYHEWWGVVEQQGGNIVVNDCD